VELFTLTLTLTVPQPQKYQRAAHRARARLFSFHSQKQRNMQYARYGKPTGTSIAAIQAKMKKKGRLPPFVPKRIPLRALSLPARQESKYLDTTLSFALDLSTEVVASSLNLVTQGDTATTRDGNVIVISSLEIQGRLAYVPQGAATAASCAYMWIILDRQADGTAPTATGNATSVLTGSNTCDLLPLPANQWTFKTLGKIVVPMVATAGVTTAYNNSYADVHWYKKFKNGLEIRFNGNAGTVADVMSNNILLIAGAMDTDDAISFTGVARIRFTG